MQRRIILLFLICLVTGRWCSAGGITDTSASRHVKLRSVDIKDVRWTEGFWNDRFDWCREVVIPNMQRLLEDPEISGLIGLIPREDNTLRIAPLIPSDKWDWFCLDNIRYHGWDLTILWDRNGSKYQKGKGLRVFADGIEIANSDKLTSIKCTHP